MLSAFFFLLFCGSLKAQGLDILLKEINENLKDVKAVLKRNDECCSRNFIIQDGMKVLLSEVYSMQKQSSLPGTKAPLTEPIITKAATSPATTLCTVPTTPGAVPTTKPNDCGGVNQVLVQRMGPTEGLYAITPAGGQTVVAYCSGGAVVFQRRSNNELSFDMKYKFYEHGFGQPAFDYWLGLQTLHHLTKGGSCRFRAEFTVASTDLEHSDTHYRGDEDGKKKYLEYEKFEVGDSKSGYVLSVGGKRDTNVQHPDVRQFVKFYNNRKFSAQDKGPESSCAFNRYTGWWFNQDCVSARFNGDYLGKSSREIKKTWKLMPYEPKNVQLKLFC